MVVEPSVKGDGGRVAPGVQSPPWLRRLGRVSGAYGASACWVGVGVLVTTLQEGQNEANDLEVRLARLRHPGGAGPMDEVVSRGFPVGIRARPPSCPRPSLRERGPQVPALVPWPCGFQPRGPALGARPQPGCFLTGLQAPLWPETGSISLDLASRHSALPCLCSSPISIACTSLSLGANPTYSQASLGFPVRLVGAPVITMWCLWLL